MARESHPPGDGTPTRRATSAEPSTSISRLSVRTPGSQARGPQRPQQGGLSVSGRKAAPLIATPHARAALRAIDSRRAAILTPHRGRRQSLRAARETPRDFLLPLARALARNTQAIPSSSSSPGDQRTSSSAAGDGDTLFGGDAADDDDDDLPKRPRLSLPIDMEDEDDSDLQPHRSAGLEDENMTARSIELPRRALSEQPGSRYSLASNRMSDFFSGNANEMLHSEDVGIDSGFFPPINDLNEETLNFGPGDISAYERLDSDAAGHRVGEESGFGIEVPDMNESTFMIAPQVQDSPTHQAPEFSESEYANEILDARSDDESDQEPAEHNASREDVAEPATHGTAEHRAKKKKSIKVSKHGIEYPSLPPAVVKRLAQTFAKTSGAKGKISPDTLKAIVQASDWFFEQLGDDLQAYAKHAGRKTIEESDMLTLMRRQRQTNPHTTPFALAQRYLPRELLQELRMPPPIPLKRRRTADVGEEHEDVT
ncbi:centromere kinetochore component CENP-T-domain-containing protein [Podospora didyma]|uniref:Centromere kinetochore component CENP-T-domain-containing protein n=1 Tax=Podospora didyma TaxID=330526 RepID=A0AAE0U7W5_9PEZI|nr:centromere kinetochore component CENP-T-domain-containing protein [Podospora didyma]